MKTVDLLLVFAALAGMFTGAFNDKPQPIQDPIRGPNDASCAVAYEISAAVDIPSHRVDYQRMDSLTGCAKPGDLLLMPVTGAAASRTPMTAYDATAAMNDAVVYSWEVAAKTASNTSMPMLVYDATAAMNASVVNSWEMAPELTMPRLVYDATAAMNDAVVYSWEAAAKPSKPLLVYDATAAMDDAVVYSWEMAALAVAKASAKPTR